MTLARQIVLAARPNGKPRLTDFRLEETEIPTPASSHLLLEVQYLFRRYIHDFIRLCGETATARELYDRMLALYPDCINPRSLWGSANAAETHAAGQSMTLREALFIIFPRVHEAFPHASAAGEFHQGGRAGPGIPTFRKIRPPSHERSGQAVWR
jgi:hypothetical protein